MFIKIWKFHRKNLYLSMFLIKFIKTILQHRSFPVKLAKIPGTLILKKICERLLLRIFQEELLKSASKFLYFNIYILFKFSTLDSISQHGILQEIMSNASLLYMTHLAEKETKNFEQVLKLIELKFISRT